MGGLTTIRAHGHGHGDEIDRLSRRRGAAASLVWPHARTMTDDGERARGGDGSDSPDRPGLDRDVFFSTQSRI